MSAQSLPALQKASEVVTGTLPNGISYYLVTNRVSKGVADFALVQKGAVDEESAKAALTDLPHFQGGRPYQYLAKLGVGYKKYGYFRSEEGSTAYHFQNIPVDRQAVRDTVLLLLFDISETCPYEQAVIISGDIDKNAIQERMNVFSMMVTPREKADPEDEPEWRPSETVEFRSARAPRQEEAVLTVSYSAPRTPKNVMNTVQPLVSEMFARELGLILCSRVEQVFREKDIPLAGVDWDYSGSSDGPGNEKYSLSLTVPAGNLDAAVSATAAILAELDAGGASVDEFGLARSQVLASYSSKHSLSNVDWVSKCSSAFLYGSDLASPDTIGEFFATRDVPVSRERELFNSFVSALLDRSKSLELGCVSPGETVSRDRALNAFNSGWDSSSDGVSREYAVNNSDTLGLYVPKKVKAKLKRTVPEPVTGGELWTFSNGMKVIFKQSSAVKGGFAYGFLLNGGYADVPDLARGEGGYVADMLKVCDVAGLSSQSFARMLKAEGIVFEPSASLTDLRISGTSPSSSFHLLMKSLLSIANARSLNKDSYEYYRASELLKVSVDTRRQAGINAVMDTIMCPDYIYADSKLSGALADDLPERAEKYFTRQFSKCEDGILVLVGDLDPFMLKKVLPKYLGGFATGGIPATRPQISYTLRSGWSTYTVDEAESDVGDGELSVNVAESALLPFSLERYAASEIALMELEKKLASALCETGMYAEVSSDFALFPSEKLTFRILCRPTDGKGLPSGIIQSDPLRTLAAVRSALSELSSGEVPQSGVASEALSKESLNASKATFLARYEADLSKPEVLVDMALMRYSVGKDRVSGYKEKINAVKLDDVKEVLSALEDGSKVEYVIY